MPSVLSWPPKTAAGKSANSEPGKVIWDPVITYTQTVFQRCGSPIQPGSQNLALNKAARSKVLVSSYRPFDAVDGDLNTAFTVHAGDPLASGDDWLQIDLENSYLIDHYVVSSQTRRCPAYRPAAFKLQKSDDGFNWADVDTVTVAAPPRSSNTYGIPMMRSERGVPAFRARYVRLYLIKGKPIHHHRICALLHSRQKLFWAAAAGRLSQ